MMVGSLYCPVLLLALIIFPDAYVTASESYMNRLHTQCAVPDGQSSLQYFPRHN